MTAGEPRHVAVLGAGIVGICCALSLRRAGFAVTLVDRDAPSSGCSAGNACVIATNGVLPLASPALLARVPRMLFDRRSPLALRWTYLPRFAPWLLRFVAAAGSARRAASSAGLAALQRSALQDHRELADAAGCGDLLRDGGWLHLFREQRNFLAARAGFAAERELGVQVEELDAAGIAARAPALAARLRHGVFYPQSGWVLDARSYGERLAADLRARGADLLRADVRALEPQAQGVRVLTDSGELHADAAVVALGAWSGRICRQLGEPVPLDTERGYHVTLPRSRAELHMPAMIHEHKVVATPTAGGLRLAGTVEFAGTQAPPDYRRARQLLALAEELFDDLDSGDAGLWMGCRPTLPDSLPVLGASARHRGVYYAFGHQHLGLTLAAVSGRLIAELLADGRAAAALDACRVDRF